MGGVQKQMSEKFEQRLTLQSNRMDSLSENVQKQQKTAEGNAQLLQNLLIGVENMGENLKKYREKMESWKTSEFQDAEREFEDVAQEMM